MRLLATNPRMRSVSDMMRLLSSICIPRRLAANSLRFCSFFLRSSCPSLRALLPSFLTESSADRKCFGAGGNKTSTSSRITADSVSPARKPIPPSTSDSVSYSCCGVPIKIVAWPSSLDVGISTPFTARRTHDSASSVIPESKATASLISCTANSRVGATTRIVPSSSIALVTAGRKYERVLPEPVGAIRSKFSPERARSADAACIGVGAKKPSEVMVLDSDGKRSGSVAIVEASGGAREA
mmetsp:Transcript_52673/g.157784  ORF Transcript_52673/g.157784 Transcript_52673/m.157784 type:complete len:241 (-) Transcript_52673:245-967(-)